MSTADRSSAPLGVETLEVSHLLEHSPQRWSTQKAVTVDQIR
jgi:hypothetical protein